MRCYQLKYAKAHFVELVSRVSTDGPFVISGRGARKAVLVPMETYHRMYPHSRETLLEFFRRSPLRNTQLSLERDQTQMRKVDL